MTGKPHTPCAISGLIDYHVLLNEGCPPLKAPAGYDFVLAGNGLFKRGENRHLRVMQPLLRREFPGLEHAQRECVLKKGKIPARLVEEIVQASKQRPDGPRSEAMFYILAGEEGYTWTRPERETAGAGSVQYERLRQDDVVMEIHSHHDMKAFFSGTDDADELGFRLYGVLGRVNAEWEIKIRVGLYGDRWDLPPFAVFTGAEAATGTGGPAAPGEIMTGREPEDPRLTEALELLGTLGRWGRLLRTLGLR